MTVDLIKISHHLQQVVVGFVHGEPVQVRAVVVPVDVLDLPQQLQCPECAILFVIDDFLIQF